MNPRKSRREELGISQPDAAARAGVSMATWRRWEEDPTKVRATTRTACERVLDKAGALTADVAADASAFQKAWGDCPYLSPRQASAIARSLSFFADLYIGDWLDGSGRQPLHEVAPFDDLNLRVMMLVGENRAWAALARERCLAVADDIEKGVLPFHRPGCYFDELAVALALPYAEAALKDDLEMFADVPARMGPPRDDSNEDADFLFHDDEWGASDAFDEQCRWEEWQFPTITNHPLLPVFLAAHHPHTWFDPRYEGDET